MRGYIKINSVNEVIDFCAGDCILDGGIQIDISMEIIIDNPLSYKYIDGEFVKNAEYGKNGYGKSASQSTAKPKYRYLVDCGTEGECRTVQSWVTAQNPAYAGKITKLQEGI